MLDLRVTIHRAMVSLVHRLGGIDAVSEVLRARWGANVSKGTVSRKMSADLDWTVADMLAIEDALGDMPVRQILARSARIADVSTRKASAAVIAKECGEAISAVLNAAETEAEGDRAQAIVEIDEAISELRLMRMHLEVGANE